MTTAVVDRDCIRPAAPGGLRVSVIIPTHNEADALPHVLRAIPDWVSGVVVVDWRSNDGTPEVAARCGALVIEEPRHGYGRACLSGIAALPDTDVIVFLDGDASDDPGDMNALLAPIAAGEADMVLGSRTLGRREKGALTPQQIFGNWLACRLMRTIWGGRFSDLGPFRAITRDALERLDMRDENYGWTIEMQVKALKRGLRFREVPVSYRRRIGVSKVSGTIRGVIGAGTKILYVIAREAFSSQPKGQ